MAQAPRIIGLGELLWDVFPDGRQPGGAPANVAYQAQRLGCRGTLVTRVGQDADGDELLAFLKGKGLDLSAVQRDEHYPTGRVTVEMDATGKHTFTIHTEVAWDHLQLDDSVRQVVFDAAAICFGTLSQRDPEARATILSVLDLASEACLRVFDVNLRQQFFSRDIITQSLSRADVLKLNDEEVTVLAELLGYPESPAEFCRAVLERTPVQIVCVTRGAAGCLICSNDGTIDIPGVPVQVVDTVGAGDAFTGAFIVAQLRGWPLERTGRFANRVGGLVAEQRGAMPELDLQSVLQAFESGTEA